MVLLMKPFEIMRHGRQGPTHTCMISQRARFMGPTWGPPGSCRPQVGPMLALWLMLSGLTWLVSAKVPDSYVTRASATMSLVWFSRNFRFSAPKGWIRWGLNKVTDVLQTKIFMNFTERILVWFKFNFKFVFMGQLKYSIIGPSNHLAQHGHFAQESHYSDVIMGAIASQITSLTIVYSTVYSGTDKRKHQSSASLAFVRGIHRWPVNSPHKWPVTRKMFPFDDVIIVYIIVSDSVWQWSAYLQNTWHLQKSNLWRMTTLDRNRKKYKTIIIIIGWGLTNQGNP